MNYKKILHKKLDDPEQAAEYLTACYDEGPEVFLAGLRDVVVSHVGKTREIKPSLREFEAMLASEEKVNA